PPACRARRSRAPALRGNRGSGRCPRRSACRCAFFAPWKSARGFLPLFHLVFRSVPLPFSGVLRYNLSWTKYSLLRLWILALSFYLIGLALSVFFVPYPNFYYRAAFSAACGAGGGCALRPFCVQICRSLHPRDRSWKNRLQAAGECDMLMPWR